MKMIFAILEVTILTLFLTSCGPRYPNFGMNEVTAYNPIRKRIEKTLTSYQLELDAFQSKVYGESLVSHFMYMCITQRKPFSDLQKAEKFMNEVLDKIVKDIEAPSSRLYLEEFPFNRDEIILVINFIDPRTRQSPYPPYYSRVRWTNGKFDASYRQEP